MDPFNTPYPDEVDLEQYQMAKEMSVNRAEKPESTLLIMYNYQTEKAELFTDQGQRRFLEIRDRVKSLPHLFEMQDAIRSTCGSNWAAMACIDRLVELGEIREVPTLDVAAQHRVFKRA